MTDLFYIVLTIIFLAVTWWFVILCQRLMENKK
jgi:hypothetical protein